ncbi:SMP-30/gluconolactonase/LRE family protein, partial [Streptomyces hundungensis]
LPTPPARAARAMEVDAQGRVLRHLKDTGRRYRMATGVAERDGRLVLGSLTQDAVAWCELR